MVNKPAKCPFCGNENVDIGYDGEYCWVQCRNCGAQGSGDLVESKVIDAWNRVSEAMTAFERTKQKYGNSLKELAD